MIIHTNASSINEPLAINLNNVNLNINEITRFLGLVIDNTLSWQHHVEHLTKKLNKVCYSFRIYISGQTMQQKMIYHTNFETHLWYYVLPAMY